MRVIPVDLPVLGAGNHRTDPRNLDRKAMQTMRVRGLDSLVQIMTVAEEQMREFRAL